MTPQTEFYDSAQHHSLLAEEFFALIKYRDLLYQLIARNLKTRYKRSVLGVVWTLLNPILTMIVLTVVFSQVFRFSISHYPVYILSGTTAWLFFSSTTYSSIGEMIWSGALLHRIYVPKTIFPVAAIGSGLINLLISLVPLLVIAVIIGVKITPAVLLIPLAIILLIIFALGIGLLLATACVYFGDMLPVYEVILTIWMYSTPLIYPIEIIPKEWVWLIRVNPMYYLVDLFRTPLFKGVVPDWQSWVYGGCYALAAFIIGALVFTSKSHEYAYRI